MLNFSLDEKIRVVIGPPGSGKTLLAVYYLRNLYLNKTGSVSLLIFTNVLHRFIQSGLEELELPVELAELAFEYNRQPKERDYLIIDEFQDFPLKEMLNRKSSGAIGVFLNYTKKGMLLTGDGRQRVYDHCWKRKELKNLLDIRATRNEQLESKISVLTQHYRIAKAIADVAAALLPLEEAEQLRKNTLNEDVEAQAWKRQLPNISEKAGYIKAVVRNRGLSSVGVLVWNKDQGEHIYRALFDAGASVFNCITTDGKKTVDFNDSTIKVMTVHSAKGVQFDCVFLPFGESEPYKRDLLYVGSKI